MLKGGVMEFIIQKVSMFYRQTQDISEAKIKEVVRNDKDNSDDFRNVYNIDIDSIEQLMRLIKKYGDVIIGEENFFFGDKQPTITIYDDHIE
jgi:hypothetical protein